MPASSGDDQAGETAPGRLAGDGQTIRDVFEALTTPTAATEGPEHTIVAANAAFRAFAHQPDPLGKPARQVFPAFPQQQIADLLDLVYAAGEPFTAREWPVEEERYMDFTIAPWRGSSGGVRGVLVTQADVTEQVQERQAARQPPGPAAPSPGRESAAVQEAMLPSGLPVLPRARIAARYLPAAVKDAAGGDWFDAFALTGGRVALMVGDVAGDGVAASAAMGRLRAVLRQALTLQSELAAVLAQADQFAAGDPALRAVTLCVVILDPANGEFCYATCGHPPPIVAARSGTARHLSGTGARPLGVGTGPLQVDA
ncbi:MAG TPA: SpoIIE family protein phosphatase, partial [Streptosporangiaceae bacterium]